MIKSSLSLSLLVVGTLLLSSCFSNDSKPWMGEWKIAEVICPFECISFADVYGDSWKTKKIKFGEKFIFGHASSCEGERFPGWGVLEATTAGAYLTKSTDNEEALKKPKVREELPSKLGLKPETPVQAGVLQCYKGEAFNIMYIDAQNAFLIGEENSFLRLKR